MATETAKKIDGLAWTEVRKKNGLDPLGMQVSGVNLYQTLLPGISNVTLRMRYYGLYAWLSWMYAQHIGDTNPETWKRFVRRTEALYALIAFRRGGEGGIAGIEWAGDKLKGTTATTINFAQDADPGSETYYLRMAWGVYGQAYESQLYEIGILTDSKAHQIAVPSPAIGDRLAREFDTELGELAGAFFETIQRGTVTLKELDGFARLAPAGIRNEGNERELYEGILFTKKDAVGGDRDRRLTLLLILRIADHLGRVPKPEEVRWILYAGKDAAGRSFEPGSAELIAHAKRWSLYQANDLCHFALEAMLKLTLDTLGNYPQGLPASSLVAECAAAIIETANPAPASWHAFVDGLSVSENPNDPASPECEWRLTHDINNVRRPSDYCGPEEAWKAIRLLCLLYKRQAADPLLMMQEFKGLDPEFQRSILTEFEFLKRNASLPFPELLHRLIEERVMRRHLWVALRKFRHQGDYTFLIEADDGRVRLRDKDGPVFTNPRLGPAIRFLRDIHLIGDDGLTKRGAEVANAL